MAVHGHEGKVAIICAGGGMRSAHGAGFLYALATKIGILQPDIIIGSSGNAGNVLYYSAGQYESIKRIWLELLSTPKFISPWRFWKIMDVDYVVDEVLKHQEPLNIEALSKSPIEYFIPVTSAKTGKAHYICRHDHIDPFEAMRITKALPVFFGKRFPLFGSLYFDGEIGQTVQGHVAHAVAHGAQRILVIDDTPNSNELSKILMELYALMSPEGLREAIIRDVSTTTTCVTAPGATLLCVRPTSLPASTSTRDKEKLRHAFEQGASEAAAMEQELHEFFAKPLPVSKPRTRTRTKALATAQAE